MSLFRGMFLPLLTELLQSVFKLSNQVTFQIPVQKLVLSRLNSAKYCAPSYGIAVFCEREETFKTFSGRLGSNQQHLSLFFSPPTPHNERQR